MIDKKPIEKDTHIHCYMAKTNRSGNTTPPYPQIHEIDHSTITNSRSNIWFNKGTGKTNMEVIEKKKLEVMAMEALP